ncbi:hypothetical protein FRB99_006815, partial [Tulasnella sp. 403]
MEPLSREPIPSPPEAENLPRNESEKSSTGMTRFKPNWRTMARPRHGKKLITESGDEELVIWLTSSAPVNTTGRFCDVFHGTDKRRRQYALKRCRSNGRPYADDLKREIEARDPEWRALAHDHLLSFLGVVKESGLLCLVSPWMDKGSLEDCIKQGLKCDLPKCLYQVAAALSYLHENGIVHGEVRAKNVLMSESLDAYLGHFGHLDVFSKFMPVGDMETARRESPELWDENSTWDSEADPKRLKRDVWAFGLTIYEVLSGRTPFEGCKTILGLQEAVSKEGKRPPREHIESSDIKGYAQLWNIAEECWKTDPNERPSMASIAASLVPKTATGGVKHSDSLLSSDTGNTVTLPMLEGDAELPQAGSSQAYAPSDTISQAANRASPDTSPATDPSSRFALSSRSPSKQARVRWAEDPANYTSRIKKSEVPRHSSNGVVRVPLSLVEKLAQAFSHANPKITIVYIQSLQLGEQSKEQLQERLRGQVQRWKALASHPRIVQYAGYAILDDIGCMICEGYMVDLGTHLKELPNVDRQPLVNVVINDKGEAMIRNFGLWYLAEEARLRTASDRSPRVRYAAPELMKVQRYTRRTDVWAFGCLSLGSCFYDVNFVRHNSFGTHLKEILTKEHREQNRTPVYKGKRTAHEAFPQLREVVCETLQACWNTTPQDRPSMDRLFEQISHWPSIISSGDTATPAADEP